MKIILKTFLTVLFILIVIGFLFSVYVLNAPPIAETPPPKLQVQVRTAVRGRPTVNSKPLGYTESKYRFDVGLKYLSNLNIGVMSHEKLFSVGLGQRAKYPSGLLDKELQTVFDWQEMFQDSLGGIELKSKSPKVEVLLSGKDWLVTDENGAGYTVQRIANDLNIYLPNFEDAFTANKISLSNDVDLSVIKAEKQWILQDKQHKQSYEIKNSEKKLVVSQHSKYPIETLLFKVNSASVDSLKEGIFTSDIYDGFEKKKIPLSKGAKLIAGADGQSWEVSDVKQKYTVRHEDDWLNVYINLESDWLFIVADTTGRRKGWIRSNSGTIIFPPDPVLSSRQKYKIKLIGISDRLKDAFSVFKKPEQPQDSESTD